jgi:hypothetical protein
MRSDLLDKFGGSFISKGLPANRILKFILPLPPGFVPEIPVTGETVRSRARNNPGGSLKEDPGVAG